MDIAGVELARAAYREADYLNQYADVQAAVTGGAIASGQSHFEQFGFNEGRLPSADFAALQAAWPFYDEGGYLARYEDVAGAVSRGAIAGGWQHFAAFGFREGRGPNATTTFYQAGTPTNDTLTGSSEPDLIIGFGGEDRILGLNGNDLVFGNGGRDRLYGNSGNDTIRAGQDDDRLWGGQGNDQLFGDLGNDTLSGDTGTNTLTGGTGDDLFIISPTSGGEIAAMADVITDFQQTGADRLGLTDGLTFAELVIEAGSGEFAGDTLIRTTSTGRYLARLAQVAPANLTAANVTTVIDSGDSTDPSLAATTVLLAAPTSAVNEADGIAQITLTRSGDLSRETLVSYVTRDGSATADQDYTRAIGALTFAPNQTSQVLEIPILNDSVGEAGESFVIELTAVSGATLGTPAIATIEITDDDGGSPPTSGLAQSRVGSAVTFSPTDTEAQIQAKGAIGVTIGTTSIYVGYQQFGINKNPIATSFTNGVRTWVKTDYELTNDDSEGYGLIWDGGANLYGVFSSTGTQGTPDQDFREFASSGWLKSYTDASPGGGGGGKVAIIAKIDPTTGNITNASFLTARNDKGTPTSLGDDQTNSLLVRGLSLSGGNLVIQADSAYMPRRPDRLPMTQATGAGALPASAGHNYELTMAANLGSVSSAQAQDYVV
jgi:hypothetical protein